LRKQNISHERSEYIAFIPLFPTKTKGTIMKIFLKKAVAALICICMLASSAVTASAMSQAEAMAYSNYYLLQDIIDIYLETSLYETDRETLINTMLFNYLSKNPLMIGALANALLSANDPYSAYYTAQDPLLRATSSSYGIIIADSESFEEGDARKSRPGIYISEVIEGSNADFADIRPGDRFVALDGINVEGLTLSGIKYLLNNLPYQKKDETASALYKEFSAPDYDAERFMQFTLLSWDFKKEVIMTVERTSDDGTTQTLDIGVSKGVSATKDVSLTIDKESSTANIQIAAFNSMSTFDQYKAALDEIYAAGCKNLIIDMRDNPGGQADAALLMASLFIDEGKELYYTRTRADNEPVPTLSSAGDKYDPAVFEKFLILVNENTASAAELLAYIYRSQLGAKLIGKPTFGKALGQTAYQISGGDSFTVTTLEILTLDKTSYNEIGLEPDIYVPDVSEKYEFPTGLSHFNHVNYVDIVPGAQNDAVLALEQRFGILGIIRPERIDGIFDEATATCTRIYKNVTMNDKNPTGDVTYDMVTRMTATINMYKDLNVAVDTEMNVATLYITNSSRGKRLAAEYVKAYEKHREKLEAEREAAQKEYEEEMRREMEELENAQDENDEVDTEIPADTPSEPSTETPPQAE